MLALYRLLAYAVSCCALLLRCVAAGLLPAACASPLTTIGARALLEKRRAPAMALRQMSRACALPYTSNHALPYSSAHALPYASTRTLPYASARASL